MRVGNYWYWLHVPELERGIDIAALISPLRYDVLVRRDFFSFYAEHRDLFFSDFEAFAGLVKHSPYYTWHVASEVIRTRPYLAGNTQRLWAEFVDQIHKAAELYESMTNHGVDPQFPITLKTAERILPPTAARSAPPTGKLVSARYFLADGCHRLALLMHLGYTVLPARYFRVKCFREFSPFDSTSLLARSLPIEPSAYFAFLSGRYCPPLVFERKDDFLEH
ncbi:MAG: hypothetical protein JSU72_20960, partial [Deltaproteobacteria bacterium]